MSEEGMYSRYYDEFQAAIKGLPLDLLRMGMEELTHLDWSKSEKHDMACAWSLAQTGDQVVEVLLKLKPEEVEKQVKKYISEGINAAPQKTVVRGEGKQTAQGVDGVLHGRDQASARRDQRRGEVHPRQKLPKENTDSADGPGAGPAKATLFRTWASRLSKRVPVELIKVAEAAQRVRRIEGIVKSCQEAVNKRGRSARILAQRIRSLDDAKMELRKAKKNLDRALEELDLLIRIHTNGGL